MTEFKVVQVQHRDEFVIQRGDGLYLFVDTLRVDGSIRIRWAANHGWASRFESEADALEVAAGVAA